MGILHCNLDESTSHSAWKARSCPMCMRFRNSSSRGVDSISVREERTGTNLWHFEQTRANTGVFDGRDQSTNHLRKRYKPEPLGSPTGCWNPFSKPAHR